MVFDDFDICFVFVFLCSSVCFRNVWVLACAGALKKVPDREASLIKKEYCRLSGSPHSLQVTSI